MRESERSRLSAAVHGTCWIIRKYGQQSFLVTICRWKVGDGHVHLWIPGVGGSSWLLVTESSEESRL